MSSHAPHPCRLILHRHGESEWNALGQFIGRMDVGLTPRTEPKADQAGRRLRGEGRLPDVLHTLRASAIEGTGEIALGRRDRHRIPVRRSGRLNERRHGASEGRNKRRTRETYDALWTLVKHLDGIPDQEIAGLDIPHRSASPE